MFIGDLWGFRDYFEAIIAMKARYEYQQSGGSRVYFVEGQRVAG